MAENPEELLKLAASVMAETIPKVTDAFDAMRRERGAAVARAEKAECDLNDVIAEVERLKAALRESGEICDAAIAQRDEARADLGAMVAVLGTWVDGKGGEWKQHTPRNALLALLAHVDRLERKLDEARKDRDREALDRQTTSDAWNDMRRQRDAALVERDEARAERDARPAVTAQGLRVLFAHLYPDEGDRAELPHGTWCAEASEAWGALRAHARKAP